MESLDSLTRGVHLKVSRAPAAESTIGSNIFILDIDEQDLDLDDEQLTEPIFAGPLRWYGKKSTGRLSLAVAARDRIYMISLPEHSITTLGATKHTPSPVHSSSQITGLTACSCTTVLRCDCASSGDSQEWESTPYVLDRITGMTYCLDPDTSDLCLEVVTHLSNVQVFRHIVNSPVNAVPYATLTSHSLPQWQKNMAECLTKFNIRHDLGGLAFTKTWGLANLGNYAAACITLHPGDMVEYTITSAERAMIVFGHQATFNGGPSDSHLLPWTATPPVSRELSTICSEFVTSVLRFPRERFDKLCKRIVYAAACVGTFPTYVDRSVVDLSEDAFGWLANHDGVDMSEELVLCGRSRQRYDLDGGVGVGEAAKVNISARSREILQSNAAQGALEVCEICGEGIGWHSLQEARCALGHAYVRCALTFLAIQEPGISKYCERCGKEYLSEEALLDNDESQKASHQPDVEMLRTTTSGPEDSNAGQEGAVGGAQSSATQHGQALSSPDGLAPLVRMLLSTYDISGYKQRWQKAKGIRDNINISLCSMEHSNSLESESFLLSETPKGSPQLVLSSASPTKSVRTDVISIAEQQDYELRTIDNFDSQEPDAVSISAATDDSTRAIKSPGSLQTTSTEKTEPNISQETTTTRRRAGRSLRAPTNPRFLRLTSEAHGHQETTAGPTSFFDDSDSDSDHDGVIAEARQGHVDRPQLVEHRSSSGLMLGTNFQLPGSTGDLDNRPGPSKSKAERILGTQLTSLRDLEPAGIEKVLQIRQGSLTASQPSNAPSLNPETLENPVGLGIWLTPEQDGLRSHSLHRSATAPPRRKVTFPPSPLDVKPGHHFLRQSIVSTPYPRTEKNDKDNPPAFPGTTRDSVLTFCLYNHNSPVPKISRIVVPKKRASLGVTDTPEEKQRDPGADFDDEKFFNLIRTEYAKMRGPFRRFVSLRGLQSINPLSYKNFSQLALRFQDSVHPTNIRVENDAFVQERMLSICRRPKLGRGQHEWVNWEPTLPGKITDEQVRENEENIMLEFVEGWSVPKIIAAIASVVVLSVVAAMLWVLVGVGSEQIGKRGSLGWRDAGGRVETGMVLGAFVLLLGWTVVGAWVAWSWLIM
ncbi:MAG: hypothetical protein M1830_001825 [Pleopsidium flavum]|nr:MAG: hypothetical protein M1830_001825 [Pleopsidium flavum]